MVNPDKSQGRGREDSLSLVIVNNNGRLSFPLKKLGSVDFGHLDGFFGSPKHALRLADAVPRRREGCHDVAVAGIALLYVGHVSAQ